MLVAIAPVIIPLVAIGVAAAGTALYYAFGRPKTVQLQPTKAPKGLPPAKDGPDGPDEPTAGPEVGPGKVEPGVPVDARITGVIGLYEDAAFHDTQEGDNIERVVRKILNNISPGAGDVQKVREALRVLINESAWNRAIYGEPGGGKHAFGPEAIHVVNVFLPKHEQAIEVMELGFFPIRTIKPKGGKLPNNPGRHGDLWIPALNPAAVANRLTTAALLLAPNWPDGTRATEPPPEVFVALQERQAA